VDDALHIDLMVSAPANSDEELDRMTRQLLRELKTFDLESVQLKSEGALPAGAKGVEAVTAGTIAVSVLPAVLPKIVEFLQGWTLQGRGRTIKFKGKIAGQNVDFEGSMDEMEKLVAMLEKQKKQQARRRK
jgi:hypothetical protein